VRAVAGRVRERCELRQPIRAGGVSRMIERGVSSFAPVA